MRFHCAGGHIGDLCDAVDGKSVHQLQCDAGALFVSQQCECAVEVYFQAIVGAVGELRGGGSGIEVSCESVLAGVIVEHIIGNLHEPCGEAGHTAKRGDVHIGFHKGVLCKVVGQLNIAQRVVQKEPPHGRLVFPYKGVERFLVMEYSRLRDEGNIIHTIHSTSC